MTNFGDNQMKSVDSWISVEINRELNCKYPNSIKALQLTQQLIAQAKERLGKRRNSKEVEKVRKSKSKSISQMPRKPEVKELKLYETVIIPVFGR
ncbi:FACT complex subunit spt16-like [Drosophila obscura]|uniref:FACT complex subunit spt16-like n=1 Tax=Drosophila obscura TaxID=7282 RepID=UPI001BB2704F|nr:FACT complex subunit spt16-like [Drosophila obscura]